jgi:predicted RNA binding protein YcfA (HicA-like mRNA interferase family)
MKLPRGISGRKVMNALIRAGFYIRRYGKGTHVIMRRDKPFAQVVVPMYKSLDTGTLDHILEDAGLSVEEFIKLL